MPYTRDGQHFVYRTDPLIGERFRLFTEGLDQIGDWPEDAGAVETITVRRPDDDDEDDDEPEPGQANGHAPSGLVTLDIGRGPPNSVTAPLSPTKAPPFKQRVKDALEVARQEGFGRVRLRTRDGATFEFIAGENELPATETNDFDTKPPRKPKQ
jgi:hypothetical protein